MFLPCCVVFGVAVCVSRFVCFPVLVCVLMFVYLLIGAGVVVCSLCLCCYCCVFSVFVVLCV